MSLGEAFIEVRADLRPFGRDLRRSVRPLVEAFEREMNNAVGRAVLANSEQHGRAAGDRISRGIKNSLTEQFKHKNVFIAVAAALGSALDDGISALPTEIKAAIVLGLLAAAPLLAGGLTGALVAGIGGGVTAIGVLLGSQFDLVQERAVEFGRNIRRELVASAGDFVPAILNAFDMIEARVRRLRPLLDQIFNVSSNFLEPLLEGVLGAIEGIVQAIFDNLDEFDSFVEELGSGIHMLGDAIGQAIGILVSTGEDGVTALRDLIALVSILIIASANLLRILTHVYSFVRKLIIATAEITGGLSIPLMLLAKVFRDLDEKANRLKSFVNTNTEATQGMEGLIVATKGETDALKDYRDAIEAASDAVKNQLELSISWEESLDNIRETLDRNGKTMDIGTKKGRENVRAFLDALKIAEDAAVQRVRRGELTGEQAALVYSQEVAQLRQLAREAGITEAQFELLFQQIIETGAIRISATEMGVDDLRGALGEAGADAEELFAILKMIMNLRRSIGAGAVAGVRGFAEGGILRFPETIRAAETGPEAIIPLTKPARAAQLLQQSGLSSMLGGGGPSQVLVFIGNEQLDTRMVRIVERGNQAQALALNHGGRTF